VTESGKLGFGFYQTNDWDFQLSQLRSPVSIEPRSDQPRQCGAAAVLHNLRRCADAHTVVAHSVKVTADINHTVGHRQPGRGVDAVIIA